MRHTLIIAEAGVNHNGSLDLAKQLALTAKECGADIVKFPCFKIRGYGRISEEKYRAGDEPEGNA